MRALILSPARSRFATWCNEAKSCCVIPAIYPRRTRDYAAYDLIHLYNDLMDNVPVGRSVIDRYFPCYRVGWHILRLKRHVSTPGVG